MRYRTPGVETNGFAAPLRVRRSRIFRNCNSAESCASLGRNTRRERMRRERTLRRGGRSDGIESRPAGVWGSNVNNLQGERIGVITEVVIDRPRSKVVFVIIKLDDHFAATPGTRIAVRWSFLRLNLDVLDRSTPYLLDLTRKQLRIAPRLDGLSFRDMCAPARLVMVPVAQHRACCALPVD